MLPREALRPQSRPPDPGRRAKWLWRCGQLSATSKGMVSEIMSSGVMTSGASFAVILPGASAALLMMFWLFCIFDLISTDSILVRNLPKGTWLFLVIFFPMVGGMAWVVLGRPEGAGMSLGGQRRLPYEYDPERTASTRVQGIEDSDSWRSNSSGSLPSALQADDPLAIRERKLLEREAELAKREAELTNPEPDVLDAAASDDDDEGDD